MLRFVLQRIWQSLVVLVVVTLLVFLLGRISGNPARLLLPIDATQEQVLALEEDLGLHKPLHYQYGLFLGRVLKGDLGRSYVNGRSVGELFWERFPATLELTGVAMAIVIFAGIPLGVGAALNRGGVIDLVARWFSALAQATPSFWLAFVLIAIFGVWLRWLPFVGREEGMSVILPAIAVAMFPLAGVVRLTRSGLLEVLAEEYIFFARAKGLRERVVVLRHALRNALIPVVTFMGVIIVGNFLIGSLSVEVVFAWPGVGYLAWQSVIMRDFPTLQGLVLIFAVLFVIANLAVDVSYAFLDPRIRRLGART